MSPAENSTPLTGKKALVTGGGGFIGSHLVESLVRNGAKVRAFVHYNSQGSWGHLNELDPDILREVEVILGDVTDPVSVKKAVVGQSHVFHLAALIGIPYSYTAPQSYIQTNCMGTLNVMQAALECGTEKVVHTSTSEAYGTAVYTPIDEGHPLQGQSPYSASKIGADKIAESYYLSFGLPVATIRPFNTYGPRQSARAIIPTVISQALQSATIRLGSLEPIRDFNFVSDTVGGFIAIGVSEKSVGRTINIGSGRAFSIGEVAQMILKQLGKKAEISHEAQRIRPEKSEVMNLICNAQLAYQLCGWTPHYSLEEGISKTIEYIRTHLHSYRPDLYHT